MGKEFGHKLNDLLQHGKSDCFHLFRIANRSRFIDPTKFAIETIPILLPVLLICTIH